MRAAAKELDAMIVAWGASEDELMQEHKETRKRPVNLSITHKFGAEQEAELDVREP